MAWSDKVFLYCERGLDPSFWAEPLNAATNGAFLLAAGLSAHRLSKVRPDVLDGGERLVMWSLTALVAAIGIGSFLFHTHATRWALLADVGPITAFMVAYLTFALRSILGLSWLAIALTLIAFLSAGWLAGDLTCGSGPDERPAPCLNGSLGYLPALIAMWVIGAVAWRRDIAAGRQLLLAGGIFLVSAAFRTIDRDVCALARLAGQVRGTHALWHTLNAVTLYMLLSAAFTHLTGRSVK